METPLASCTQMSHTQPETVLRLDGADVLKVSEILAEAYFPPDLTTMLLRRLNRVFRKYMRGDTHQEHVYYLVATANSEGWIASLLSEALDERPSDTNLAKLLESLETLPNLEAYIDEGSRAFPMERFHQCERWVCRIECGGLNGSGLLVGPDLVLTNNHVYVGILANGGTAEVRVVFDHLRFRTGSLRSTGRAVSLDTQWDPPRRPHNRFEAMPQQIQPEPIELDYAILKLAVEVGLQPVGEDLSKAAPDAEPRGWLQLPDPEKDELPALPATGRQLNIFQYFPNASGMVQPLLVSQPDVVETPWNGMRIRYTGQTSGGSSGAPCFNQQMELVAIHHAAQYGPNPTYNQGIPLSLILHDLANGQKNQFIAANVLLPWQYHYPSQQPAGPPQQPAEPAQPPPNPQPPAALSIPSPSHMAFDSLVIGTTPQRVFVNRTTLRSHLRTLVSTESSYRVLAISGEPDTGKSHSRSLIEHVAKASGVRIAYFDAAIPQPIEDACLQLADRMGMSDATIEDMEKRVLVDKADPARIGRKFASWLLNATEKLAERWWLIIDGLSTPDNPHAILRDHLVGALLEVARDDDRSSRIVLILLGGEAPTDPFLSTLTLTDPREALRTDDISAFFRDYAARKGKALRDDEVAMLTEKLLGPGSGPLTPQQMRSLQTGIPEILKVLS